MPHSFPTRPSSALHRHRLQGWACRGISALRPRYSCSDGELLALAAAAADGRLPAEADLLRELAALLGIIWRDHGIVGRQPPLRPVRSEEHTSELQSLMRISYAVFCLTKKTPKSQLSK